MEALMETLVREPVKTTSSLTEAMAELNILPFTERSVRKYKRKLDWYYAFENIPGTAMATLVWSFIVTFMATVPLCGIVWLCFGGWPALVMMGGCLGILTTCLLAIPPDLRPRRYEHHWQMIPSRTRKLPEFAAQTARDLQERCPSVKLCVDELIVNRYEADPFLVAIDTDGKAYYIEVWGEPTFKREYQ